MEINWIAVLVAALVPMLIGFIYYHPKVVGTAWMKASGMTEEKIKSGNMLVIFGVSFVFALMLSMSMHSVTIHQFSIPGTVMVGSEEPAPGTEEAQWVQTSLEKYGDRNRSFKHGVAHGMLFFLFFGLPILATNALFERKGFKYILINGAYWLLTVMLMGGIICGWT